MPTNAAKAVLEVKLWVWSLIRREVAQAGVLVPLPAGEVLRPMMPLRGEVR